MTEGMLQPGQGDQPVWRGIRPENVCTGVGTRSCRVRRRYGDFLSRGRVQFAASKVQGIPVTRYPPVLQPPAKDLPPGRSPEKKPPAALRDTRIKKKENAGGIFIFHEDKENTGIIPTSSRGQRPLP